MSEYRAYLTPEIVKLLEAYFEERHSKGERLLPHSPLFKVNQKSHPNPKYDPGGPLQFCSIYGIVERCKKKANISCVKSSRNSHRYEKANNHAFRKFMELQLLRAKVHPFTIKKLVSHKPDLEWIYTPIEIPELFEDFKNAIPYLTILEENRQKLKTELVVKENKELNRDLEISKIKSSLEKTNQEIVDMKNDLHSIAQLKSMFEEFLNQSKN